VVGLQHTEQRDEGLRVRLKVRVRVRV